MAARVEHDDRDGAGIADDRVDHGEVGEAAGVLLIRAFAARAACEIVVVIERAVEADVVIAGDEAMRETGYGVDDGAPLPPLGGIAGIDFVAAPDHGRWCVASDVLE